MNIRTVLYLLAVLLLASVTSTGLLSVNFADETKSSPGDAAAASEEVDAADSGEAGDATKDGDAKDLAQPEEEEEKEIDVDTPYEPESKAKLRRRLSRMQYDVTQNEATEPAFRNRYWDNKQEGVYKCIVCDLPLFTSNTKFKSGTGWPSFWAPVEKEHVGLKKDWKLFYTRVEVHCRRCGAHLGHVFDDGPPPTGKRYCMNSAALEFEEGDDKDDTSPRKSAAK